MSLTRPSAIAVAISLALFGPQAYAKDCLQRLPNGEGVANQCVQDGSSPIELNNLPVVIEADYAEAQQDNKATYRGNVIVTQGPRTIRAEEAVIRQPENIVTAFGNVEVKDNEVQVTAERVQANLNDDTASLFQAEYSLVCQLGRGDAELISRESDTTLSFNEASFTTCPPEDNSWLFSANKIEYDQTSPYADLYGAKFAIKDVTVMYIPFIRLPASDQRLSGFLYPDVSYGSRNGIDIATPYYWNIAPNYDFTFTPTYMEKRGLMTHGEFRYLNALGLGGLTGEYMHEDKEANNNDALWGFNWTHSATYADHWLVEADYSQVSVFDYFEKGLGSDLGSREDSSLLQTGSVAYRTTNWDANLRVRDFQSLTSDGTNNLYRVLPQFTFNHYGYGLPYGLRAGMMAQFSRFDNDDITKPTADRVHLQPSLYFPYASSWWSFEAEAKLMYTHYTQEFDATANPDLTVLEEDVSRTVPSFRVVSGVTLERDMTAFGDHYTQTLEPKLQYLFVRDVDQSEIYNPLNRGQTGYDTTLLQLDYHGLFRDRQYSGLDYIAGANQFTLGAASRIYDDEYRERFMFAYGQIFYLNSVTNYTGNETSYSASAFETEFNYNDRTFFNAGLQYDATEREIQFGNATIEYRIGENYVQTNYRYISQSYLQQSLPDNDISSYTRDGISQAGFSTGLRLSDSWYMYGDVYYDTNEAIMSESQISLNYESCCWAVSLGYNEYLKYRENIATTPEYESNISFSFRLLGLGGRESFQYEKASGNALSYGRPFYLNN
uniref:LPS assembly protein LptD n=1 Tax=Thaumasiovibrio occultus TaxID=1891184 RepID=UPI000B3586AA|nr:LPS assembly protein LptD [Thaumasiovibrio occultus]